MTDFEDDLSAQAAAGEEDQDQAAGDTVPAPMIAGTFAVYETPDGGYMLVTETARGVERKMIPGKLVRLATRGPGARMFGQLFG